jgi:site-specific recombinase XerD
MTTAVEPLRTNDELAAFLLALYDEEAAPLTIRNYQSDLAGFARWFEASVGTPFAAREVTPTDVRDYRASLVAVERRKPATVNRRLAALRKFFAWAKGQRLITELPTDAVKGVPQDPRAPRSLERREVGKLLREAERRAPPRDRAILLTLRHTGLRVGELCALRLGDIDISERKGTLVVRQGKGAKQRELPLNADVRAALSRYRRVRPQVDDDHLFLSQKTKGALSTQAVTDVVARYARLAGLEAVTPHTLRHSFGKHLLDAGEALPTVAAALGHSNLNTTAIYTQPSVRDLVRAVEKLERER